MTTIQGTALNDQLLGAAINELRNCEFIESAFLLGSAATQQLRPDSDVDIAVLCREHGPLPVDERLRLSGRLTAVLGRPVDLGVLTTSNVVYAKEAVAGGRLIFERDHRQTARFAMLALSMYASLQEARREVLRAYAA